jgi:tetratricopeptide (TPR) repeat protein
MHEAEAIGEQEALARACYVLDWALFDLGRAEEAEYSARALEIYAQLGNPEQESAVLNNLGGMAFWRGDWEAAIDWYRRQAEASERSGNPADVAFTDANIGEILSDQGHLEEASAHLRRARRVWSSTGEREGTAFASFQLGRATARAGHYVEGLALLESAAHDLRQARLADAQLAWGLVAEAEAFAGDPARALTLVDELLPSGDRDLPLLRRVRGIALARLERRAESIEELELSVAVAEEHVAHYDLAASLDALELIAGHEPARARQRDAILAQLSVTSLPRPTSLTPAGRPLSPTRSGADRERRLPHSRVSG